MTDQQPRLFQIWLDASDGSIATYDGVQWPDGTADVHHRYRRPDGVQWTPESLARMLHGKQARVEWAPDLEAQLAEARMWARHGYELGQRSNAWSDHGVAPTWLTEGHEATHGDTADGFRWHVLSRCEDETACPIHGRNEDEPTGPEDGFDQPELTTEDAVEAKQEMAQDLYTAQDRLAFIGEMCDAADRDGSAVTTERVRTWLAYQACGGAIVLPEEEQAVLRERVEAASAGRQAGKTRAMGELVEQALASGQHVHTIRAGVFKCESGQCDAAPATQASEP